MHLAVWRLPAWLWVSLCFFLALIPRVLELADFITVDEGYHWIERVTAFRQAIETHNWQATNLTGHPGVTTMWLGSVGLWLIQHDIVQAPDRITQLAALRLPLAVTNALGVAISYLLLRRLVRPTVAVVAAVLWALSPFSIAFARLLHVDALTTTFGTLAILLLLCSLRSTGRGERAFLIASGMCAGLMLLSKSSAVVLVAWAMLLLVLVGMHDRSHGWMRRVAVRLAFWFGSSVVTFWICWPAMWVAPVATMQALLVEIINNGGQAHATGTFFLGRTVADPGWLFYPIVLLFRSDPFLLIGLGSALIAGVAALRHRNLPRSAEAQVMLALSSYAVFFILVMTLAGKKFDRYMLPAFPALCVVGSYGLIWLWERIPLRSMQRMGGEVGLLILLLGLISIDRYVHPYYLSFYNPLLGGGRVAEQVLPVGWGEGMDKVATWLNARPDLDGPVLTWIAPTLQPLLRPGVRAEDLRPTTLAARDPAPRYVVLYSRNMAWYDTPEATVRAMTPLATLQLHGITYANIYQPPVPFETPFPVAFDGDKLALRGYTLQTRADAWQLTLSWDVRAEQEGGVMLFVHVLDAQGQRVTQMDTPIDGGMFAKWQAGQQFGTSVTLAIPPELAAGQYQLILGAYRPGTPERLPVQEHVLPVQIDGENAVKLTTVTVTDAP